MTKQTGSLCQSKVSVAIRTAWCRYVPGPRDCKNSRFQGSNSLAMLMKGAVPITFSMYINEWFLLTIVDCSFSHCSGPAPTDKHIPIHAYSRCIKNESCSVFDSK